MSTEIEYVDNIDDVPMPPYHIGCRTTTIPVLNAAFAGLGAGGMRIARGPDGQELVPANQTYFEWLQTQPADFQDSAIGPRRGELLRDGGLSASRFAELNLGRNFQPRTLEEMRRLEPVAFVNAMRAKEGLTLSSGKVSDEKDGTVILEVGTVDFNDSKAVMAEVERFAKKYAHADIEHALIITTGGGKYIIKGKGITVDPGVIGEELLRGSIGIHNHPLLSGGDSYDSFSISDLKFAAEHGQGKQYLISGTRRNAFEFTGSHTPAEVEEAWNKAYSDMLQTHRDNGTLVVWEQEERLRIMHNYLKGFKFYDNF